MNKGAGGKGDLERQPIPILKGHGFAIDLHVIELSTFVLQTVNSFAKAMVLMSPMNEIHLECPQVT